jgi:protein-ribulosamine 3-kinase
MFDAEHDYELILFACLGFVPDITNVRLVSAGNVNQAVYVETDLRPYLLKVNFDPNEAIFQKEAEGLNLLRKNCSLKVPEILGHGQVEGQNYLLMEYIDTGGDKPAYWLELAEGLAELHMSTKNFFGLEEGNFIASLPQNNDAKENWTEFFVYNRLDPLIGRAYYENLISKDFLVRFQRIYNKLEGFFPKEKPSLLHGDLWSGNILRTEEGKPALIDPAVYYGNREVDLAFSKLFGGFDAQFYEAYDAVYPLEPGFEERVSVYNLYPLLVHLLLFGKAYLPAIEKGITPLID